MRTTPVIPDPVFKRAKAAARRSKRTLSDYTAEALEALMANAERAVAEPRAPYCVPAANMGAPSVDVSDREALFRRMEDAP